MHLLGNQQKIYYVQLYSSTNEIGVGSTSVIFAGLMTHCDLDVFWLY